MWNDIYYQLRWTLPVWLVGLATNWLPDNRISCRLRGLLVSLVLPKCGKGFSLGANVTILNPHALTVGDYVYIARGAWLNCMAGLTLEDEVVLGPYVTMSTLQHTFKNGSVRFGGSIGRAIRIKRGSWLASHVSVKCGVTVGAGNLVAANACVVKDTPDGVIVGGVPAKVIGPNEGGSSEFNSRAEFLTSHPGSSHVSEG